MTEPDDQDLHEMDVPLNDFELAMLDNLKVAYGVETRSEVLAKVLEDSIGDIHPDALVDDEFDLDALMSGDLKPVDVDEKFKIGHYDADGSEVTGDE